MEIERKPSAKMHMVCPVSSAAGDHDKVTERKAVTQLVLMQGGILASVSQHCKHNGSVAENRCSPSELQSCQAGYGSRDAAAWI